MFDPDISFYESFFARAAADRLSASLRDTLAWRQETITMFGKRRNIPRLTAWHGDAGKGYTYSGISLDASPWTAALLDIKAAIEVKAEAAFNSVLANLYRDERDSVSWHSDDEPELGRNPVIASVSFGEAREFQFKHKTRKNEKRSYLLTHGSLLIMKGETQHHWLHQIPKRTAPLGERINLTFRVIIGERPTGRSASVR